MPLIDWTPFFQTWELAGHYPAILTIRSWARRPRSLFRDAERAAGSDRARAAAPRPRCVRLLPGQQRRRRHRAVCRREPQRRKTDRSTPSGSRWSSRRAGPTWRWRTSWRRGRPAWPITSAPSRSRRAWESRRMVARFEADHDDYNAILAKALADRLAEAFAERLHQRVRTEFWGYAPRRGAGQRRADQGTLSGDPAGPGLSGLPRPHREADSLRPARASEESAGITLTESFAMLPAASVSGYYFWRPQVPVLRGRQDRARPGGGLCPAQGDGSSRRSSAGSLPT